MLQPQLSTSENTDQQETELAAGDVPETEKSENEESTGLISTTSELVVKKEDNNFMYWLNAFETKMGRKVFKSEVCQVLLKLGKARKIEALKTPIESLEASVHKDVWAAFEKWKGCPKKVNNFGLWKHWIETKSGIQFEPGEIRQVFLRLEKARQDEAITTPFDLLEQSVHNDVWAAFEEWTSSFAKRSKSEQKTNEKRRRLV